MRTSPITRYILVGVGAFALSWLLASGYQLWQQRNFSQAACATSMRIVYVATKHLPAGTPKAERLKVLKRIMFDGFKPTVEENKYLTGGRASPVGPTSFQQAQWALLCAEDPKFPVKVLMSRTTTLDFKPSYELFPDNQTALYCPYHQQAVLMNGDIVSR